MKPILYSICFLLAGEYVSSQNCNFYYLQNDKTAEITIYNKKQKETGKNVYKMSSVKKSGSTTTGVVESEIFNNKGKSIAKATNNVKCSNGVLMIDMKMFMSPEQAEQIKAEAKASDVYLAYPVGMKAGDALEDGKFTMDVEQNNGMKSTVTINITNRKVEVQESVTTTAGTWNCFKISYKTDIKITMMGIGIPVRADVTEWFAPGFGVVKTESSKGGTTVLTKFE